MTKQEIVEAAKNHSATSTFSEEEIEKAVDKYYSRIDFLYSDTPAAEVDHMIDEGYFDIK